LTYSTLVIPLRASFQFQTVRGAIMKKRRISRTKRKVKNELKNELSGACCCYVLR